MLATTSQWPELPLISPKAFFSCQTQWHSQWGGKATAKHHQLGWHSRQGWHRISSTLSASMVEMAAGRERKQNKLIEGACKPFLSVLSRTSYLPKSETNALLVNHGSTIIGHTSCTHHASNSKKHQWTAKFWELLQAYLCCSTNELINYMGELSILKSNREWQVV